MIRRAWFAVLIALFGMGVAQASQSIYPDSGGTFTVGSAIGSNIALAAAPISNGGGTTSFQCKIASTSVTATLEQWSCSSGTFSLVATDGSVVAATFSTGSLSFSGSSFNGYSYQFNGSFVGTLKKAGVTTAISGATTQFIDGLQSQLSAKGGPVTGGTTGVNSLLGPLYVADFNNARIVRSDDLFGTNLTTFHGANGDPNHFFGPSGITVNSLQDIFVTDSIACRVAKLENMTGLGLITLGTCGSGIKQFSSPGGIALDKYGRIYVADSGNNRIVRMDDMGGTNWTVLGSLGIGANQFSNPLDVTVDSGDHIYVADSANARIVRMDDMKGTNWTTFTRGAKANEALTRPSGLSMDSLGRIYIADSGLLIRLDDITGANWASFLTGDSTNAVSVDPSGTIYITGGAITRIDSLGGAGWTTSGIVANAEGIHATGMVEPIGSLAVSPASLSFGLETAGTVSKAKTFTLTNMGTGPLAISSVTAPAGFTDKNTCPASLTPATSCNVTVSFAPTAAEAYSGKVIFKTNGQNPSVTASVSGTGELPPAVISVKPLTLNFGTQLINTTSLSKTVTIANTGGQPLTLSLSITSGYLESTTCAATLSGGDTCLAYVQFAPVTTGSQTGGLVIINNTATPTVTVALSGVGGSSPGELTMTPAALDFGSELLNTTSAAKTITVKNTGGSALNLTGLAITGAFNQTSTCGTSLDAGATCKLTITFTPVSLGAAAGSITLSDNEKPATVTTTLSGTGSTTAGVLTVQPASLAFGAQLVGTTGTSQVVTLSNTGKGPVTISGYKITGSFAESTGCPATLAAGASCIVNVAFAPTAAGASAGSLTILNNTGTSPSVALSGTGVSSAGGITMTPASLTFTSQVVAIKSAAQKVTVTNPGAKAISLTAFAVTGPFAETTTCSSTLAAGASCTVSVTFTPTAAGAATGALTITNTSPTPKATVALSGTGTSASSAITLSPAALTFTSQLVGTTSAAQAIKVTNTGSKALSLTAFAVTGAFAETTACPASLAVGASCTVSVTFKPTADGATQGTLTISNSSLAPSAKASLTGTGAQPAGGLTLTPAALYYAAQAVGTPSKAQAITVTNTSSVAVSISSFTVAGPFAETNTCPASLPSGGACAVSVTFTPTASGVADGKISIANSGSPSIISANLVGTGASSKTSALVFSPAAVSFGAQVVDIASAAKPVKITNSGTGQVNLWSISITGGFNQTNNCGTGLAAGASCVVNVAFDPSGTGLVSGQLQVANDSATPEAAVDLSGTGTAPKAWLANYSLNFPVQLLNTVSGTQSVLLGNSGTGALTVKSIKVTGPFLASSNCGATVAVNSYCLISVTFNPGAVGQQSGTLTIADNDSGYPATQTVQLSGTGTDTAPAFAINPGGLLFLPETVGTTSVSQNIVVTNSSSAALPIESITVNGTDFSQSNTCAGAIAANSSCLVSIKFTARAKGVRYGAASMSVGSGIGFTVQLTGVGQ